MPIVEFLGGPCDGERSDVPLRDPGGSLDRREAASHTLLAPAGLERYVRTMVHTPDGVRIFAHVSVLDNAPRSRTLGWQAPRGVVVGSWWVEEDSEFLILMWAGSSGAGLRAPEALVRERGRFVKRLDHVASDLVRKAEQSETA